MDFVAASAAKALMNGVVLAIDWEKRFAPLACFGDDQVAGRDQAFFVGYADGLPGPDGFVGGFQSCDSDDGADDEVSFGMGGDLDRARRSVDDLDGTAQPGLGQ